MDAENQKTFESFLINLSIAQEKSLLNSSKISYREHAKRDLLERIKWGITDNLITSKDILQIFAECKGSQNHAQ